MFYIRVIGILLFVRDILKSIPVAMLWPRPYKKRTWICERSHIYTHNVTHGGGVEKMTQISSL